MSVCLLVCASVRERERERESRAMRDETLASYIVGWRSFVSPRQGYTHTAVTEDRHRGQGLTLAHYIDRYSLSPISFPRRHVCSPYGNAVGLAINLSRAHMYTALCTHSCSLPEFISDFTFSIVKHFFFRNCHCLDILQNFFYFTLIFL